MKQRIHKNMFLMVCALVLPMLMFAQNQTPEKAISSDFSNTMYVVLVTSIFLLLLVIIMMGLALKNIIGSDFVTTKLKKNANTLKNNEGVKSNFMLLAAAATPAATDAGVVEVNDWLIGGLDMTTFFILITIIIFEVAIIAIFFRLIMHFTAKEKVAAPIVNKPKEKTIFDVLNASVDIEDEHDIMLDHEYDGIRELDNSLPPWWKYGFYLTIVVAVVYLANFHIFKTGDLQVAEYNKEVAQAKIDIAEYMKTAANNVDETNVKLLTGADLVTGKELFVANCAACHGAAGEGKVGPNLTDRYWLHGGGLADVFKSIKYGWVEKGMKPWQEDFSPNQIAQLTSFIYSLKGTNPPGAKEAQGDLYTEAGASASDSLAPKTDSLAPKIDSLKTKQDSVK